jgi:hypothetical protein
VLVLFRCVTKTGKNSFKMVQTNAVTLQSEKVISLKRKCALIVGKKKKWSET